MFDDIDDGFKLVGQAIQEMHHKHMFSDWRVDLGEEVGRGLHLLAVVVNREVNNHHRTHLVFKFKGASFLVVSKDIFDGKAEFTSNSILF